jgi:hypothetical protein
MKKHEKVLHSILSAPPKEEDDFSITITRYFTDVNGLVLLKTDPLVPVKLRTRYPFYLFNKFDKDGFYAIGQKINQLSNGINFIYQESWGYGFDLFRFNATGDIYSRLLPGDFIQVYADDPINFTTLVWIVVRCQNRAYSSMIDNIHLSPVIAHTLLYGTDNVNQYMEPFNIYKENTIGRYESDFINPFAYKPPYDTVQNDFIRIPLTHKFHPLHGFSSYIQFNTENLFINFLVKI